MEIVLWFITACKVLYWSCSTNKSQKVAKLICITNLVPFWEIEYISFYIFQIVQIEFIVIWLKCGHYQHYCFSIMTCFELENVIHFLSCDILLLMYTSTRRHAQSWQIHRCKHIDWHRDTHTHIHTWHGHIHIDTHTDRLTHQNLTDTNLRLTIAQAQAQTDITVDVDKCGVYIIYSKFSFTFWVLEIEHLLEILE